MKIINVIVDELPETCEKCSVFDWYDGPMCGLLQWKRDNRDPFIFACEWGKERCQDCPLILADKFMDKYEKAFKELAKGIE